MNPRHVIATTRYRNELRARSLVEEALSALWLIAGLLCHLLGWTVLGWILIGKAALDTLTSICFALAFARRLRRDLPGRFEHEERDD